MPLASLKWKYFVDLILIVSFIVSSITGFILLIRWLSGILFFSVKGLGLNQLFKLPAFLLHIGSSVIFFIFSLIHLKFNYRWISSATKKLLKKEA